MKLIIVCPNCSTRYEVAAQAIGDHGRSVQCANCQRSWHAQALKEDDFNTLLGDALDEPTTPKKAKAKKKVDEDALDIAFNAEEDKVEAERRAAQKPMDDSVDVSLDKESQDTGAGALETARDMAQDVVNSINEDNEVELKSYAGRRRQQIERMKRSRRIAKRRREIARALPMARLRRNVSLVAMLISLLVLGTLFGFQDQVVQRYPDLAGFYRLFGQNVNVVGLEFVNVKTDRIWRDGHEVLSVRSQIENVTDRMIYLPPIRVALIDDRDEIIYEWNTTPGLAVLEGRGIFEFKTELSSPPLNVKRVKMKFLEWQFKPKPKTQEIEQKPVFGARKSNQTKSAFAGKQVAAERLKAFNKN